MYCAHIVLVLTFLAAVTEGNNSCYDREDLCYVRHMGFQYVNEDGDYLSDAEARHAQLMTPVPTQCRRRQSYINCAASLLLDTSCSDFIKNWIQKFSVQYEYQCIDQLEDTEKYWRCLTKIKFDENYSRCKRITFSSTECSAERYLQCVDDVADSSDVTECQGHGILRGTKNYYRGLIQAVDNRNVFCP